MRTPTRIASFAAQKIVPTGVLRGVLRGVDHAAGWTAVRRDVLKAADVDELDELRTASLEKSDLLAQRVELRAMALDRTSVVSGKSVSVRVDLGGRRIIRKKPKHSMISPT